MISSSSRSVGSLPRESLPSIVSFVLRRFFTFPNFSSATFCSRLHYSKLPAAITAYFDESLPSSSSSSSRKQKVLRHLRLHLHLLLLHRPRAKKGKHCPSLSLPLLSHTQFSSVSCHSACFVCPQCLHPPTHAHTFADQLMTTVNDLSRCTVYP